MIGTRVSPRGAQWGGSAGKRGWRAGEGCSQRQSSKTFMNTYCVLKDQKHIHEQTVSPGSCLILKLIHRKQIKHCALNFLNVSSLLHGFKNKKLNMTNFF